MLSLLCQHHTDASSLDLRCFSTTAISESCSARSSKMCLLLFICAISRPRKRSVILTLLPLRGTSLQRSSWCSNHWCQCLVTGGFLLIPLSSASSLHPFLTCKIITILTVINYLAYRRLCIRSNLDKVKTGFICNFCASLDETTPICSPSGPIRRTSLSLICSLIINSLMVCTSNKNSG